MGRERRDLRSLSLSLYGDREGGGGAGAREKKCPILYISSAFRDASTTIFNAAMPTRILERKSLCGVVKQRELCCFFCKKKINKKLAVLPLSLLVRSRLSLSLFSPVFPQHPRIVSNSIFQSLFAATSTTPRLARSFRASAMSLCSPALASGTSRNVATPRSSARSA